MTPEQAKQLGDYLRSSREEAGMSASGLASASGLTKTTILRIEHGEFIEPSAHKLAALAEALSLSLANVYAHAGYLTPAELPTLTPYLRARYGQLPEEAVHDMEQYFHTLASRYGYEPDGPKPGADEM